MAGHLDPARLAAKGPQGPSRKWVPWGPVLWATQASPSAQLWPQGHVLFQASPPLLGNPPTLRCPPFEETPHFLEPQVRNSEPWPAVDGPGPLDQSSLPCAQGIAQLDPKGISSPPPHAQLCPLPRQLASPSPITGAGSHLPHAQKVPGHSVPRIYKDILKARQASRRSEARVETREGAALPGRSARA